MVSDTESTFIGKRGGGGKSQATESTCPGQGADAPVAAGDREAERLVLPRIPSPLPKHLPPPILATLHGSMIWQFVIKGLATC